MKHLRQISAAVVLTFVLAVTSFAGDMPYPIAPPPPPSATGITDTPTIVSPVEEIALNLVRSVLLLF
jgi:NADH:ubiquinone oxidoreductase subunit F (NADH-binding)